MKEQEISDYAKFVIDNMGFIFVDRRTSKVVDKWEIHNTFGDDPIALKSIYNKTHSRYARILRVKEMKEQRFNF